MLNETPKSKIQNSQILEKGLETKWLEWAKKLQAIAQNGLAYSPNPYDVERFEWLREIAAEIMATYSKVEHNYVMDLFSNETGYATPKVDVRGVVFQDNKILLVKERDDGGWTLPGGWADIGDTPSEVAVKEVLQESGYETRVVKLLAVYDRDRQGHLPCPFYIYKLLFLCELVGGSPSASIETSEVGFFPENAIPQLSLGRTTPAQITRMFEYYRDPNLPTDFD